MYIGRLYYQWISYQDFEGCIIQYSLLIKKKKGGEQNHPVEPRKADLQNKAMTSQQQEQRRQHRGKMAPPSGRYQNNNATPKQKTEGKKMAKCTSGSSALPTLTLADSKRFSFFLQLGIKDRTLHLNGILTMESLFVSNSGQTQTSLCKG